MIKRHPERNRGTEAKPDHASWPGSLCVTQQNVQVHNEKRGKIHVQEFMQHQHYHQWHYTDMKNLTCEITVSSSDMFVLRACVEWLGLSW